jgi:hypothetical protein
MRNISVSPNKNLFLYNKENQQMTTQLSFKNLNNLASLRRMENVNTINSSNVIKVNKKERKEVLDFETFNDKEMSSTEI